MSARQGSPINPVNVRHIAPFMEIGFKLVITSGQSMYNSCGERAAIPAATKALPHSAFSLQALADDRQATCSAGLAFEHAFLLQVP